MAILTLQQALQAARIVASTANIPGTVIAVATPMYNGALAMINRRAPDAPDDIKNLALERLFSYLWEVNAAGARAAADPLRTSGAASVLAPYIVRRAAILSPDTTIRELGDVMGINQDEVLALIANWAEAGNSEPIPASKLVNAPSGGGGLSQSEVDSRVQMGVADWAEEGNTDDIPLSKLGNAPSGGGGGLSQSQVDARVRAGVSDWAEDGNTDFIPGTKIFDTTNSNTVRNLATNVALSAVADWAEDGNSEPIPASKLTNAPSGGGALPAGSARGNELARSDNLGTVAHGANATYALTWTLPSGSWLSQSADVTYGLQAPLHLGSNRRHIVGLWFVCLINGSEVAECFMPFGYKRTNVWTVQDDVNIRVGSDDHNTYSIRGDGDAVPVNTNIRVYEATVRGAEGPAGPAGPEGPAGGAGTAMGERVASFPLPQFTLGTGTEPVSGAVINNRSWTVHNHARDGVALVSPAAFVLNAPVTPPAEFSEVIGLWAGIYDTSDGSLQSNMILMPYGVTHPHELLVGTGTWVNIVWDRDHHITVHYQEFTGDPQIAGINIPFNRQVRLFLAIVKGAQGERGPAGMDGADGADGMDGMGGATTALGHTQASCVLPQQSVAFKQDVPVTWTLETHENVILTLSEDNRELRMPFILPLAHVRVIGLWFRTAQSGSFIAETFIPFGFCFADSGRDQNNWDRAGLFFVQMEDAGNAARGCFVRFDPNRKFKLVGSGDHVTTESRSNPPPPITLYVSLATV